MFDTLPATGVARDGASVVALPSGLVAVVCGAADGATIDVVSGAVTPLPNIPSDDRVSGCAVAATSSFVVIAGGMLASGGVATTAEIYDATTLAPIATAPLVVPRTGATAIALPNGQILVAGGDDATGAPIANDRAVHAGAEHPAVKTLYPVLVIGAAVALVAFDAPSWLALAAGLAIALARASIGPSGRSSLTTLALQAGVVALGAGMNLDVVLRVGLDGALVTATSLALAVVLGLALGRALAVPHDTSLMLAVGTGICGGSAIAAIASVIRPKDQRDLGRARGRVRAQRDRACCCSRSSVTRSA